MAEQDPGTPPAPTFAPADPATAWRITPTLGSTFLVIAAIGAGVVVTDVFHAARRTVGWAFASVIVAWLLSAVVEVLSRWMRRGVALMLGLLGVLVLGVGSWVGVVASLNAEVGHLKTDLPDAAARLEDRYDAAARFRLHDRVESFVDDLDKRFGTSATVSKAAGTGPAYFVNGVLLIFFLGYGPRYLSGALKQIRDGERRERIAQIVSRASHRARTYVLVTLAQVIVVVGIASGVFTVIKLPAPFVLGLLLGAASAVPYLGAILGGLPAILVAAADLKSSTLITVIVLMVAVQVAEVMIVRRRLDRATVRVGPALPLIVGIIGFQLYGTGGAAYGDIALVFGVALLEAWRGPSAVVTQEPAPAAPL